MKILQANNSLRYICFLSNTLNDLPTLSQFHPDLPENLLEVYNLFYCSCFLIHLQREHSSSLFSPPFNPLFFSILFVLVKQREYVSNNLVFIINRHGLGEAVYKDLCNSFIQSVILLFTIFKTLSIPNSGSWGGEI